MFHGLLDLLFPGYCLACRREGRERWGLCSRCLVKVSRTGLAACLRCGRICSDNCAPLNHRYGRVLSLALYQGPWRHVVQAAKFARDRSVANELARDLAVLAQGAGFALPQVIVPVPSASNHWRHFDAVDLVVQELSSRTGAPSSKLLKRRPGRVPQVQLTRRQRLEGLDDFIYTTGPLTPGALVWLVDDVYTTGATVDACAGALQRAGARSIYVLVLGA